MESSHRIPCALYCPEFTYGEDKAKLIGMAMPIIPEEYTTDMQGDLYCPSCTLYLDRIPSDTDITTSSREAYFRHRRGYSDVECSLRTQTGKGKKYSDEESTKRAIENGDLAIISDWMENPPEEWDETETGEFSDAQIIDEDGEEIEIPKAVHDGENFSVPSKITSVYSLCKNFPLNISKYYYFPNSQSPIMLRDAINSASKTKIEDCDSDYLYYGRIMNVIPLDARNLIKIENKEYGSIHLYTMPEHDKKRRISKDSIGKTIMFHSQIIPNERGPRAMILKWGQYALLPSKYDRFMEEIEKSKPSF